MVDRCHIYMSGSGYYRQIQYLTVMYHHSNSVTLAAEYTKNIIIIHLVVWFGTDLYTKHIRSS